MKKAKTYNIQVNNFPVWVSGDQWTHKVGATGARETSFREYKYLSGIMGYIYGLNWIKCNCMVFVKMNFSNWIYVWHDQIYILLSNATETFCRVSVCFVNDHFIYETVRLACNVKLHLSPTSDMTLNSHESRASSHQNSPFKVHPDTVVIARLDQIMSVYIKVPYRHTANILIVSFLLYQPC